ncbi:DEAD-box ATP-dependent RNA helicase 1-like isoform X2 [Daucus carota subsp. sativus]|uniref:DEAD-box ATP-dependent RNA helicase 1-like isoform X2 n=1 Tax=Daucus carota subsp. sativus TaxID=79200 RepID=UPI003083D90C
MKTGERDSKRMKKEQEENKQSVPVLPWMRSPIQVDSFSYCPLAQVPMLDSRLAVALQSSGIASFLAVQLAVWHETIGLGSFEWDLCINFPTGSGKTLAYALPIVQMLSTRAVKYLRALILLPTQDLALQVKEVFNTIAPAVGLSVGLEVGQSSIADEISELIKRPKLEAGICYDPEDLSGSCRAQWTY